jgi:hypothetical protein
MGEASISIPAGGDLRLEGTLVLPEGARGVVAFAHGSGSSRFSPRNVYVARVLQENRIATLLIVGSRDGVVIDLNRRAAAHVACTRELVIVPGASHLFEEPGTLEQAARHAAAWFERWFAARPSRAAIA